MRGKRYTADFEAEAIKQAPSQGGRHRKWRSGWGSTSTVCITGSSWRAIGAPRRGWSMSEHGIQRIAYEPRLVADG